MKIREQVDDVDGFQFPGDTNGQTFMCELVDHVEHPVFLAFMRAILDEVVGPDMVRPLGAKTDEDPSASQSRPRLGCLAGLSAPRTAKSVRPVCRSRPSRRSIVELRDLPVAVTTISASQFDDVGGQPFLVVCPAGTRRCVERCCPSTRQTRRSDNFNPDRTWSMQARRRAGLRSFPLQPPQGSFCPRLDRRQRGASRAFSASSAFIRFT